MELDNQKLVKKNKKQSLTDITQIAQYMNLDFFSKNHSHQATQSLAWWKKTLLAIGFCGLSTIICSAFVQSSIDDTQSNIQYRLFSVEYQQHESTDTIPNILSALSNSLTAQTISALSQSQHDKAYHQAHQHIMTQIDAFFNSASHILNNHELSQEKKLTLLPTSSDMTFMTNLIFQKSVPEDIQLYYAKALQELISQKSHLYANIAQSRLDARNSYNTSHFRSDAHYMNDFYIYLNNEYNFLWFSTEQVLNHPDMRNSYYEDVVLFHHLSNTEKKHQLPDNLWKK